MSADAALTPTAVLEASQKALIAIDKVVREPGYINRVPEGEKGPASAVEVVVHKFAAKQERFRSRVVEGAIQEEVNRVRVLVASASWVLRSFVPCSGWFANEAR
jgi:hypothetical protein